MEKKHWILIVVIVVVIIAAVLFWPKDKDKQQNQPFGTSDFNKDDNKPFDTGGTGGSGGGDLKPVEEILAEKDKGKIADSRTIVLVGLAASGLAKQLTRDFPLKQGSRNDYVKSVQRFVNLKLVEMKLATQKTLTEDGVWGAKTTAAYKKIDPYRQVVSLTDFTGHILPYLKNKV